MAELYEVAARRPVERVPYATRARWPKTRATRTRKSSSSASRHSTARGRRWPRPTRRRSQRTDDPQIGAQLAREGRRHPRDAARRRRRRDSRTTSACSSWPTTTSTRRPRSSGCTKWPSATKSSPAIYLTKAAMLDVPDAQKEHYFRAGQIYEEVLDRPDQAIEVYQKSLAGRRRRRRRARQADRAAPALAALGELARGLHAQGRHRRRPGREEGALRRDRRGLRARARPDRESDRDLPAHPRDRSGGRDRARAPRCAVPGDAAAGTSCCRCSSAKPSSRPSRTQALGLRYRIGELFETRLSDAYRAVEVYREILDAVPDHAGTQAALERMIERGPRAGAGGARARADLPRVGRVR